MQFWPHRRARRILPRLRKQYSKGKLFNIVTVKAGMTHVMLIEQAEGPRKNQEVVVPVTVLEVPETKVYGIRLYKKDSNNYMNSSIDILHRATAAELKIKKIKYDESKIDELINNSDNIERVDLLLYAKIDGTSADINHPIRYQSSFEYSDIKDALTKARGMLGSKIDIKTLFNPGEYVDVVSISKGKGWQGPIKRFHVTRQYRKSTNKVRHVGVLGPMRPGKIFYTVPQAGQLGFNYRTELNKQIIGVFSKDEADKVNRKEGFKNYGIIKNDYIMLKGSVPGVAKRIVRIKQAVRPTKKSVPIKITYIDK